MLKKFLNLQGTIGIIIILSYFGIIAALSIVPLLLNKPVDMAIIKDIASILGAPVGMVVTFFFIGEKE